MVTEQPTTTSNTGSTPSAFRFRQAYSSTAAARAELQPSEFVHLAFDVTLAVNTVLAAWPRIAAMRTEIKGLPVDQGLIDSIETYAQAAGHAQALYTVATAPPEELQAIYETALQRRLVIHSDAVNLATHGLLSPEAVNNIKKETGYRNVGYDLMSLVSLLRNSASRIAGRSATLPADLDHAELLANQLLELAARKEARAQVDPSVAEERLRAISLMAKAYDEGRRAVAFLRWKKEGLEKIAPSIYTAKPVGKRRPVEEPEAGDGNLTPPGVAQPSPDDDTVPAQPAVPGGLGGTPFVSG